MVLSSMQYQIDTVGNIVDILPYLKAIRTAQFFEKEEYQQYPNRVYSVLQQQGYHCYVRKNMQFMELA